MCFVELSVEDLREHISPLFEQSFCEVFIHGNFSQEQASVLAKSVTTALNSKRLHKSQRPELRVIKLLPNTTYTYSLPNPNKEDNNSAIVMILQV